MTQLKSDIRDFEKPTVLFFETHPVQYKAPVYKNISIEGKIHPVVVYASDFSVRTGNIDREFGTEVVWDVPLLEGYEYIVLDRSNAVDLRRRSSLGFKGVLSAIRKIKPDIIVLTSFRYIYDYSAFFWAVLLRIPICIRQETQDEMFMATRGRMKSSIRYIIYRAYYLFARGAIDFGHLNRKHLVKHGFNPQILGTAKFSVPDPFVFYDDCRRVSERRKIRMQFGITADAKVIAFFGKLILKKNPSIILKAVSSLPLSARESIVLLFVGAGELLGELVEQAADLQRTTGIRSIFAGFINQSELPSYYLAADILILPSRRMGEAWGLVVNEALSSGCSVVVSDAVGCWPEFKDLPRFRVVREGVQEDISLAILELLSIPRDFYWAQRFLVEYSQNHSAQSVSSYLYRLHSEQYR
jgi:glycosyltransferase involved in cell wall biosynthesis